MNKILQGNVLDRLKDINEESVQCVVTSPPYWGLRDYGTATWLGGESNCSHKRESKKSDMTITGHKNFEEMNGVGDAIYKSICNKCGAVRKDEQLGLEDTPEKYVANLVKVFKKIRRVLKKDGTIWLNIGDSYASQGGATPEQTITGRNGKDIKVHRNMHGGGSRKPTLGLKPKDLVGIPWRVAFALQADGWYLRQDIIWNKPNPMPESVKDRCTKAHEYIFLLSKSGKYYYDNESIKTNYAREISNFETYQIGGNKGKSKKALKSKRSKAEQGFFNIEGSANRKSVWTFPVRAYKEAHFAVFPEKLPELCIKAGSKKGDLVLDPFFGSGTTGWVAQRLGRKWLGIELNPEYIKIANKRFQQQELFV